MVFTEKVAKACDPDSPTQGLTRFKNVCGAQLMTTLPSIVVSLAGDLFHDIESKVTHASGFGLPGATDVTGSGAVLRSEQKDDENQYKVVVMAYHSLVCVEREVRKDMSISESTKWCGRCA